MDFLKEKYEKALVNIIAWDILIVLLLFAFALTVRITYQNESVIGNPVQKDAKEYFFIGYNLYQYKIYSTDNTFVNKSLPHVNWRRPPGYPLFLLPFYYSANSVNIFLNRITLMQAVLGSLVVVMTYLMSRFCLEIPWAIFAGLFTALSPHLIAVEQFLLSETLYTYIIITASLILVISWRGKSSWLSMLAGIFFSLSAITRPISILLGPMMTVIFYFDASKSKLALTKRSSKLAFFFVIGLIVVYGPFLIFKSDVIAKSDYVKKESAWEHFIRGADIHMANFIAYKYHPKYKTEIKKMINNRKIGINKIKERYFSNPRDYLKWYIGGKLFFLWRWDNIYIGDVYQYPMKTKGFENNLFLKAIHRVMVYLHWPVYLMALLAPLFLYVAWRLEAQSNNITAILIPFFIFIYFAGILTVLMPLPRYAIPLRPFVFILTFFSVNQFIKILKLCFAKYLLRLNVIKE